MPGATKIAAVSLSPTASSTATSPPASQPWVVFRQVADGELVDARVDVETESHGVSESPRYELGREQGGRQP